jgi:hypothetical protein
VDPVEKPLHVRVAEALGHGPRMVRVRGTADRYVPVWTDNAYWLSDGAHTEAELQAVPVPRYDTDWSATGPLIEKYRIAMWTAGPVGELLGDGHDRWRCNSDDNGLQLEGSEVGPTPLIAVCNLILALHEAGKLPK